MQKIIKVPLTLILVILNLSAYALPGKDEVVISDTFKAAASELGLEPDLVDSLCQPTAGFSGVECHHSGGDGPFESLLVRYRYNNRVAEHEMYDHTELNDIRIDLKNRQFLFWSGHEITTPDGVAVNRIQGSNNSYIETGGMKGNVYRTERRFKQVSENKYQLSLTSEFSYHARNLADAMEAIKYYKKMVSDYDYVVAYKKDQMVEPVQIIKGNSFSFPISDELKQRLVSVMAQSVK